MAEEAILGGSDPTFFCVYLPAKHLIVMPGRLAIDPAPCALYSFLHLHCLGTEQSLLPPENRVYKSLHINGTRESSCLLQANRRIRLMLARLSQAALHV